MKESRGNKRMKEKEMREKERKDKRKGEILTVMLDSHAQYLKKKLES